MKTLRYLGLIALVLFSCTNSPKTVDSVKKADKINDLTFKDDANKEFLNDADFVVEAYNIGLTEIELGTIAQQNGSDLAVKHAGEEAVRDYSKMNESLKTLADKKNITVPTIPGKKSVKAIKEIKERSGNIFDRAYTKRMVYAHTREIKTFEDAVEKATDMDIKTFASETLPMLKRQLIAAEELKVRIPYD